MTTASDATTGEAGTGRTQTLEFLAPAKLISSNQRLHYHAKNRLTQQWRQAAFSYARAAKLLRVRRAHIVITVRFRDARRRDINNFQPTAKAIVDGLVDYGVLPDDNDAHLVGPDLRPGPRMSTLVPALRVEITDLA